MILIIEIKKTVELPVSLKSLNQVLSLESTVFFNLLALAHIVLK
jgi:hypothetical protein